MARREPRAQSWLPGPQQRHPERQTLSALKRTLGQKHVRTQQLPVPQAQWLRSSRSVTFDTNATLKAFNTRKSTPLGVIARGDHNAGHHEFKVQPRRRGTRHVRECRVDHIGCARQLGGA